MVNKKGLLLTLLAVAFAGLYTTGYALAPVVSDPGDLIIGDLESGAANNVFAFPDAFNLDSIVSDESADSTILWSYSGTGKYTINGVAPLTIGPGDPNAPGANEVRSQDLDVGHPGQDAGGNGQTVTFRNQDLSDIAIGGGFGPYSEPATTGVLASETQPVTLYASDAATYTAVTIVVYTANNSSDSISGGGLTPIFDYDYTNPAFRTGWISSITGGASAGTTGTGTGFCMWVPTANVPTAGVQWSSPNNNTLPNGPGYIDLVDSAAYRLRVTMYCDQTAGGAIPYWTFGYNNVFFAPTLTSNIYGGDHFQVDVAGGASGIGRTQGRTHYDYWFIPNAALTQSWRGTLPFGNTQNSFSVVNNPSFEARNDINVTVRILDGAQGAGSILNEADTGTICLKGLRADRIAYASLNSTLVYGPPINTATHAVLPDSLGPAGNGTGTINNGTASANFAVGPAFETDAAGGRKQLIQYNPAGTTNTLKRWPLANSWHDDELLLLKTVIRSDVGGAAGTVEGSDPVNLIFVDWDVVTSEIGAFHFTQKGAAGNMKWAASPRLLATNNNVPQEYVSLFYTQNKSKAVAVANPDRIRGYLDLFNSTSIGTATDGRNPFSVTKFELYKVDISPFGAPVH